MCAANVAARSSVLKPSLIFLSFCANEVHENGKIFLSFCANEVLVHENGNKTYFPGNVKAC